MQRRGVLIGVWVLCTAAATLIAWAAVSQVAQEVSPQAVLPLPTTAAIADVSATAAPSEDQQVAKQQSARTATEVADDEAPPDEPAPQTATEAYDLVGGIVTVRYSGTSTDLVQASPESGFIADVKDQGPGKVDVRFRSDDHESRLVTRLRNGAPDPDVEERPR